MVFDLRPLDAIKGSCKRRLKHLGSSRVRARFLRPASARGRANGPPGLLGLAGVVFAACQPILFARSDPVLTAPAASHATSLSAADPLLLTDFDNETGDAMFDGGVMTQALAMELGQSPFLNILPDGKIRDALKLLGFSTDERISANLGRRICVPAGAKAVVTGRMSRAIGSYRLQLTVTGCSGADTLADARTTAANPAEVLQSLSDATTELRAKLGESPASLRKFSTPLSTITTSLPALRNYSLGVAVRREQGDTPSVPYLKRAIELDPQFALAYAVLAGVYGNLRQPSLALDCAAKAFELRDRGSERQRLQISSAYFLATGQIEKEIQTYQKWQTEYPTDIVPRNNLGNDYAALGQLVRALAEYKEALELAPSVVGYTNVGGMYLSLNQFDDAKKTFDDALINKFDGRYIRQSLYWVAFAIGNDDLMERQVAWAAGRPGDEDVLASMESDTDAYYGRVSQARDLTRRAIELAVRSGTKETAALWEVNAALREAELGNSGYAVQEVTAALALSSGRDVSVIAAVAMARAGDAARAKTLMAELEKNYPTDTLLHYYWIPCIRAAIDIAAGDPSQAVANLQPAEPYELGGAGTFINYLYPAYLRGQAYLMMRDARATGEFQKLVDHRGIVLNFVTGALAYLELGRAYAMADEKKAASKEYEGFLSLWNNADPDLPVLKQARAEFARLR